MKKFLIFAVVAGIGYYSYISAQADRGADGSIVSEGRIDAFQLRVGDCFNDSDAILEESQDIIDLPAVPCSDPHDNEVYAVANTSLVSYPGEELMWDHAFEVCIDLFPAFVGRDYETSSLDVLTMYPSPESWNQDDREIVCAAYDLELNKLTGTVKGLGI